MRRPYEIKFLSSRRIEVELPVAPSDEAKTRLAGIFHDDQRVNMDAWETTDCRVTPDGTFLYACTRVTPKGLKGMQLANRLSAASQRTLKDLTDTPGDLVAFHDRLGIIRGALRIGMELMELLGNEPGEAGAKACLAYVVTPLELTMSMIADLTPGEVGAQNVTSPGGAGMGGPDDDIVRQRAMRLDLE